MKFTEKEIATDDPMRTATDLAAQITHAKAIVLIAFGEHGRGVVSVFGPNSLVQKLPAMLHDLADRIELDDVTAPVPRSTH